MTPQSATRNQVMHIVPLSSVQVTDSLWQVRKAARALREGVATESEWSTVAHAICWAQSLERRGVVRGLTEHLRSAATALQEIGRRAMASGTWNATPLQLLELDIVSTAIELHELQLTQLGARLADEQAEINGASGAAWEKPEDVAERWGGRARVG